MRAVVVVLGLTLLPALAGADDWKFGGHIKYQYDYTDYRADDVAAVSGDETAQDQSLDLRLKADGRKENWDFAVHYELLALQGDTLETRRRAATLGLLAAGSVTGLPDDRRRLFDLTHEITDDNSLTAVHRLDRLSAGYTTERQVLRFGRQVISWGNGLVFHPLDFVNPFSPIAIDKDYKTGDDMLFAQWTLSAGGDVQALVLPRRDPVTHELESEQGSYAVKLRHGMGEFNIDILAARHVDENLIGFGLVRSVGGAVWRFDTSYTDLNNDDGAWSFATNLDYSWTWSGRNVYGYVEYFRSGVGETDRSRYATPNPALAARIDRGELFTLGRDYLAFGLQVELTPLVNLFGNLIRNMHDASMFFQLRGVYDWQQNVQLMAGINVPSGDRGDEYGGIPVIGTPLYSATGRSVYGRLAYYF